MNGRRNAMITRMKRPIPAITAPHQPITVRVVTITPAMITPRTIAGKARQKLISRRKATIEPVQAPVTGKGIATNKIRPRAPYFSTIPPRRLDIVKTKFRILSKSRTLLRTLDTGPSRSSRKGTGRRLPANATRNASRQDRSRSSIASGIAPRSSDMGAAAVKNTSKNSAVVIDFFVIPGFAQSNKLKLYCQAVSLRSNSSASVTML